MAREDLKGLKFNKLEVINYSHANGSGNSFWLCKCDCGKIKAIRGSDLKNGHTKTCGCLKREIKKTHNLTGTPTYSSWDNMRSRCNNTKAINYNNYGGRGIRVCKEWEDSFIAFLEDMGEKPDKSYTLERVDVNGDYTPENCRWATYEEQARNRRMQSNNKTGVTGVAEIFKTQELIYYRAYWVDLEGKERSKSFSIKKYGKEKAFILAIEFRENALKLLNNNGAGYSANHGRPV